MVSLFLRNENLADFTVNVHEAIKWHGQDHTRTDIFKRMNLLSCTKQRHSAMHKLTFYTSTQSMLRSRNNNFVIHFILICLEIALQSKHIDQSIKLSMAIFWAG